ncbi:MAG: carbohydrate-binding domain-containing protein, partial [Armatimonadia bacterium]
TDGEMATVTLNRDGSLVRALMIGGTYLKRDGREIIGNSRRGNVSLTANVAGLIVNSDLPQAGTVRVASKKSYKLQAPAGEKQVVLEQKMPVGQSRKVKCGDYEFETSALPVGEALQQYWWANVEIKEGDRYKVSVADATGKARVALDNKPLSLTEGKTREAKTWLAPGRHLLLLTGLQGEPRVELARESVALTSAEMLPKDYKPGVNCVIVEAEKPAAEGETKGKAMEKVGASKGVAHCVWDTAGQWAEWALTVPHEGDYRILVRGCSEQSEVKRLIEIVGTKGFAVRMAGTGGWARTTDDWRYFAVGTVHLKPGEYRLRIEGLEGSMNLDQVGLEAQR